ncbi:MAG: propanediol dehydratase small subunit PduE [Anaerolineae bacterium]|nr:propanediol dehydratase small subunit PduE [Anaerolineae bacterium]
MTQEYQYPLMDHHGDELEAASGRKLDEVTLENLDALEPGDIQVRAETLHAQAAIAREAGFTQLAANLTRAAELTAVPNDELLQMYDLLRPGRASEATLQALAERLEYLYHATETAAMVREAADAYRARGLLRR